MEHHDRWIGRHPRVVAVFVLAAASLALMPLGARAQDATKAIRLGVTTCAGSTCHGSVQPWAKSTVLQNEYLTWQRKDRHAKAYEMLLNEQSKRIARNLGLEAAHTADVCLDCHADNVPKNLRGATFQISDGVGCEACHGASVGWIGVHLAAQGHKANVAAGMYPTDDPVQRATLCLSCHLGDEKKFVNHRMMGAGHPRMPFELDTFTALQPAHFEIDDDYRRRKTVYSGVQTWAIGQAMATTRFLDLLLNPDRNRDGIFPELVFFDCNSCHHPMTQLRWQPRAGTGLQPGIVRLNDANLIMLRVITRRLDPGLGKTVLQQTLALHAASTQDREALVAAARELRASADKLVTLFANHKFDQADISALLVGLTQEGLKGEYLDYVAAQQATMALGTILATMRAGKLAGAEQLKQMGAALEGCYKAVEKDDEYDPVAFIEALKQFEAAIPKA